VAEVPAEDFRLFLGLWDQLILILGCSSQMKHGLIAYTDADMVDQHINPNREPLVSTLESTFCPGPKILEN
jgi:hypothetical protein